MEQRGADLALILPCVHEHCRVYELCFISHAQLLIQGDVQVLEEARFLGYCLRPVGYGNPANVLRILLRRNAVLGQVMVWLELCLYLWRTLCHSYAVAYYWASLKSYCRGHAHCSGLFDIAWVFAYVAIHWCEVFAGCSGVDVCFCWIVLLGWWINLRCQGAWAIFRW